MRIAGLQKLSLVDFPGHLAAVVFAQGCNFRCGYCHNPELVDPRGHFDCDAERVLSDLSHRKKLIEGVVVTGGEPTICPGLAEFLEKIKEMGFLVKLDTNGSNPGILWELLKEQLVDYVAVDIKTSPGRYALVSGSPDMGALVSESARWVLLATIPYEFRTTCVPGIVGEEDFREISSLVKGAGKYCLQQFNPSITLDEAFREVKPYGMEEINRFRDILKNQVAAVETRGF